MVLLCSKLGISRSGYYAWLNRARSALSVENERLLCQIKSIHTESRDTYGSPRVHAELRKQGYLVNRKRVARLMRDNDIVSKMRRKFKPRNRYYEHYRGTGNLLLKQGATTKQNQVWVGDMTFIRVNGVWSYLAVVMDQHTRRVLGWSFARRRSTTLAEEAIEMAVRVSKPAPETIFHSDQGIEYASNSFRETLNQYGITPSMSRKGCCWDNAHMESFFHTLKTEMVYFRKFNRIEEATAYIMDYINFYNSQRIHSSLGYQTPDEYVKLAA